MKHSRMRRLALPILAGLATSAVVATLGLAGSKSTKAGGPPTAVPGTVIGQLTLDAGAPIQIQSYSWGVSNPGSIGSAGGGAGAGKASFSTLNLMKNVDTTSALLLKATATGEHFAKAVLTVQWGTGATTSTAKYELGTVFVESVQHSGAGGSTPTESVSLLYGSVKWSFSEGSGGPPASGGWDIVGNTEP